MLETLNFNPLALDGLSVLFLVIFAVLGLIMGSFSSALIHRIPSGTGVFGHHQRSACPHCNHVLAAHDLIPLLSWFLSRGRCRYCCVDIPVLYPVLEVSSALLALALIIFYPAQTLLQSFVVLAALPFLLALFIIDIRHKILPNVLVVIVFMLGLLNLALEVFTHVGNALALIIEHIGGAALYMTTAWALAVIMRKALKKQALGMGDVKFFAVAGLWLGLSDLGAFCVFSGVIGVLFGAAWQKLKKEPLFPFGPALIISFFILLLIGGSHPF